MWMTLASTSWSGNENRQSVGLLSRMPKQLLPLFIETNGNKWNTAAIWTWMKTVGPLTKRSVRQDLTTTKVQCLCSIRSKTDVRKKTIAWFLVFNIYHFQNENALLIYQMNGKSTITKLPQWREAIIRSFIIYNVQKFLPRECGSLVSHKFTVNSHSQCRTVTADAVWMVCSTALLRRWDLVKRNRKKCCTTI